MNVKQVISDELRFKSKLAIGENAYASLKLKNRLADFWEVGGVAMTGAAVAQSTVVASTFFAPTGLAALFGIGAAVTPVGWIVAAAVLSGGTVVGIRRWVSKQTGDRVSVIPKFINSPIDVLAIDLFELIASLSLKVAEVDGRISDDERSFIRSYFVSAWGYDCRYVEASLSVIEENLSQLEMAKLAQTFAEFSKANPDCNYQEMTKDVLALIQDIIEADSIIYEHEELALREIQQIFEEKGRHLLRAKAAIFADDLSQAILKNSSVVLSSSAMNRSLNRVSVLKDGAKRIADNSLTRGKGLINSILKKP
ncbi:TerB family tellurite resistance protein [Undibacterium fentianense]|uniref:TerB family tellurite resistance protein n=1 Tax=Undibacterium fentianense TaxID=2828728 RepID=A0A941IDW5_9BURK|nr:TerB family tellurite resistance protein [Undibacterium fentianense]MBR7799006.1 TerB family tellurite resistance protein [Undibacterium fentianense]